MRADTVHGTQPRMNTNTKQKPDDRHSRQPESPEKVKRILFVNRSYYPDAEATGQLLTQLCEDLTGDFHVTVVAGQPNYNPQQVPFRRTGRDTHNGVEVRRVWNTQFRKSSFLGRAINYVSFLLCAARVTLLLKRPDVVIVESDPPLLCLLGSLLKLRYRTRLVVYLQDIYPHLAVALGKLSDNWLTRLLEHWFTAAYRNADRVIVLSQDMRDVMLEAGVQPEKVDVIPNWVDAAHITPVKQDNRFRAEQELDDRFIVMYSGNLGLCQGLEGVLVAAEQLQERTDIMFLLVGDGAAKQRLVGIAQKRELKNVRFVDYQPLSRLAESLSAADLHLIPLDPRVIRYMMPSKLYGILASGTPVVTLAAEQSELGELVRQEQVGVTVTPDQPEELAEAILWFADWCDDRKGFGQRARELALDAFDRPISVARFRLMLDQVLDPDSANQPQPTREGPDRPHDSDTQPPAGTCPPTCTQQQIETSIQPATVPTPGTAFSLKDQTT